jgi:hypothetical protein
VDKIMSYMQRIKQRNLLFYLGVVTSVIAGLLFLSIVTLAILNIYFKDMTELGVLAIGANGLGVILSLVFGRMGWHESAIFDFLLNQLSLIVTVIGFVGISFDFSYGESTILTLRYLFLVALGLFLASLGRRFSSIPPSDYEE